MKTHCHLFIFAAVLGIAPLRAQETPDAAPPSGRARQPAAGPTGGYAPDLAVVTDAQQQALEQARQALTQDGGVSSRSALETAVRAMEHAQAALESAKKSPEKLDAAIAAEQAAYQALLQATPREFRMSRSRSGGQNSGNSSGEPDQRQADQLEMESEQNRYETERQAAAPQNAQQREQTQVADRLKELAQRQQDLNDRVRELQTALQAAHTDQQRTDLQRQLKRLEEEQRQMLASVDEMRQQLEQSPNADSERSALRQLDQTRSDMERASAALQQQSPSQALAAGTRAQQGMQDLHENLRRQTASQFSDQMRRMRSEARDMANREHEIARNLDALNHGAGQSLEDSGPRQQISRQMAAQQSALTNLLADMKTVTEQAETTEPLLSKQLYDTLRQADQRRTDNLLEMGSQLVDRGFLAQAGEVERTTATNLTELAAGVERAADSVLGSQADALRYAQKELDDLTGQIERELGGETNAGLSAAGGDAGAPGQSNHLARADGRTSTGNVPGGRGTNGISARDESPMAGNNASPGSPGKENAPAGNQPGNRGEPSPDQANNGRPVAGNNGDQPGRTGGGQTPAGNNPPNPTPGATPAQTGESAQSGGNANGGGANAADRLRQFAEQLGRSNRAAENGGPITGNDYAAWAQQARDVESVLDSADLRNQLATVRDRVGALRGAYRNGRQIPSAVTIRRELLVPLSQVSVWVRDELARQENAGSLVPLDRDPVPDNYSSLVSKYYEKLGSAP
jgi:hypothetical protein